MSNMSDSPEQKLDQCIQVAVRFRPARGKTPTRLWKRADNKEIKIKKPRATAGQQWERVAFDGVYDESATQDDVYSGLCKPMLDHVWEGYDCTLMAYGQSGSGKTHTITGDKKGQEGCVQRVVRDIFARIAQCTDDTIFEVSAQCVEIYNEKIYDLFRHEVSDEPLRIRELCATGWSQKDKKKKKRGKRGKKGDSGPVSPTVYVENATNVQSSSPEGILKHVRKSAVHRHVGSTDLNARSSRSHAVLRLSISQINTRSHLRRTSNFFLVDLAGSEQVKKSGATGGRLEEAQHVNLSLSTLSLVISKLAKGTSTHVPYRDSQLTRLLSGSLGGQSITTVLLTCASEMDNVWETYSTIAFGQRAKQVRVRPRRNEQMTITGYQKLTKQMKSDIEELRARYERAVQLLRLHSIPWDEDGLLQPSSDAPKLSPRPKSPSVSLGTQTAKVPLDEHGNDTDGTDDTDGTEDGSEYFDDEVVNLVRHGHIITMGAGNTYVCEEVDLYKR